MSIITITPVEHHFNSVCEFARKKLQDDLTRLIEITKTVNFTYGIERPIERLAFAGDGDAVNFLIINFNGHFGYAIRGFARANNSNAVELLIRSGAEINYAVQGYAMAGNITAVNNLISRGGDILWAVMGYAMAGNEDAVNSLLLDESHNIKVDSLRWLSYAFLGFASGNQANAVNTLWGKIPPNTAEIETCIPFIVKGYAWANNQPELQEWVHLGAGYQNVELMGYACGGHLTQFADLADTFTPNNLNCLVPTLEELSYSEHILQTTEIIMHCLNLGTAAVDLIAPTLNGYSRTANFSQVNSLCQRFNLGNDHLINSCALSFNFFILQDIYSRTRTDEAYAEMTLAQQQNITRRHKAEACSDTILRALANIANEEFRCAIIKAVFDDQTYPNIITITKSIVSLMIIGLAYEEAKSYKLNPLMFTYHLTPNQARMWQSTEIDAPFMFLQVIPHFLHQFSEKNLSWIIASFLLPRALNITDLSENRRLFSDCILPDNQILDFTNKMSAYRCFKFFSPRANIPANPKKRKWVEPLIDLQTAESLPLQSKRELLVKVDYTDIIGARNFFQLLVNKSIFAAKDNFLRIRQEQQMQPVFRLNH